MILLLKTTKKVFVVLFALVSMIDDARFVSPRAGGFQTDCSDSATSAEYQIALAILAAEVSDTSAYCLKYELNASFELSFLFLDKNSISKAESFSEVDGIQIELDPNTKTLKKFRKVKVSVLR
jgi:hypothetical protein